MTIIETKEYADGSKVEIRDEIENFTEENYTAARPTTRTVTTYGADGTKIEEKNYNWSTGDYGENRYNTETVKSRLT